MIINHIKKSLKIAYRTGFCTPNYTKITNRYCSVEKLVLSEGIKYFWRAKYIWPLKSGRYLPELHSDVSNSCIWNTVSDSSYFSTKSSTPQTHKFIFDTRKKQVRLFLNGNRALKFWFPSPPQKNNIHQYLKKNKKIGVIPEGQMAHPRPPNAIPTTILMCNMDIKGQKFVCMGVNYLAFNVLLHTKSEQKVIGNWFCTQIISLKTVF